MFLWNTVFPNEVSTRHDMNYGQAWYPALVDKLIDFTKAESFFLKNNATSFHSITYDMIFFTKVDTVSV